MFLSFSQQRVISRIMNLLAEPLASMDLRVCLGEEILRLVDADQYASYVWDDVSGSFADRVTINMSDGNLKSYERYYQFRDPITLKLQQMKKAALVEQVLPQDELVKTEFFNDFLAKDGLYWGVNLFAWDDGKNIGDIRIWRGNRKRRFDHETLDVLNLIAPAFTTALRRTRVGDMERAKTNVRGATAVEVNLSPREWDVADLAAQGTSDKEIAQKLRISFTTVRTHISHIFEKLCVENRVQLAAKILTSPRAVAHRTKEL